MRITLLLLLFCFILTNGAAKAQKPAPKQPVVESSEGNTIFFSIGGNHYPVVAYSFSVNDPGLIRNGRADAQLVTHLEISIRHGAASADEYLRAWKENSLVKRDGTLQFKKSNGTAVLYEVKLFSLVLVKATERDLRQRAEAPIADLVLDYGKIELTQEVPASGGQGSGSESTKKEGWNLAPHKSS